ncbi:MAG: hypothetical protein GEU74_11875 [Nitriliruptorales bacterium]|nr:hypothetical protein [Nitriliruptorales bacterium]
MDEGINLLRAHRGPQKVSFSDIADHLFDYCDLHPDEAEVIGRFAAFLAAVEYIPHDHDAHPDRGIPAQPVGAQARAINVG